MERETKKVTKKKKTQKQKIVEQFLFMLDWLILAVTLAAATMVLVKVQVMGILPAKFFVPIVILFLILLGLGVFFTIKKKGQIPIIIVSVIMLAILIYGALAIGKLDKTLNELNNVTTKSMVFSVVVRDDDPAKSLSDIDGYDVGYYKNEEKIYDANKKLKSELGKVSVNMKSYDSQDAIVESLLNSESLGAIFLNQTSIALISDSEEYENFEEETRVIGTVTITYQVKVTDNSDAELGDTLVVYMSGIDTYGAVDITSRSDVNILAFINVKTGKIQLISTPRDYYVQCPLHDNAYDKLTNCGLYGIDCSEDTLEQLYGGDFEIDYYLRVNFSGFIDIIDELGGVDVTNETAFTSVDGMYFEAGDLHLDGQAALYFARERKAFAAGDIMRAKHQMAVISAMVKKCTSSKEILTNYANILDAVSECFQTDMPASIIYQLVNHQLSSGTSWDIQSYTLEGEGTRSTEAYSQYGRSTYVMLQDADMIAEAKKLIDEVLSGN